MNHSTFDKYCETARPILELGHLGFGHSEDWLIKSGSWFYKRLTPNGGSFADYFGAALDRHVALLCSVDLDSDDPAETFDLDDFLSILLNWILEVPTELLRKSAEPLTLVISGRGSGNAFGTQILRKGGPSLIFWETFRSLRRSLSLPGYQSLVEQIIQTLVHELIGHQLAFCASSGPCLNRDDLREICAAADIREIKLIGKTLISVDAFLETDDLLSALQRIEYIVSHRNPETYYGNIVELIAFAVEGGVPDRRHPYAKILAVLKKNLLRLPKPLNGRDGRLPLYRGFYFSAGKFHEYFIENNCGRWRETRACRVDDRWMTLAEVFDAAQDELKRLPETTSCSILSGQSMVVPLADGAFLLGVDGQVLLSSPFGIQTNGGESDPMPMLELKQPDVSLKIEGAPHHSHSFKYFLIRNSGEVSLPIKIHRFEVRDRPVQE